jgi:glycosyltransferase involved in cell wall biosynthesis
MRRDVSNGLPTRGAKKRPLRVAYITTVPVQGGAELNLMRVLPHLRELGVTPAVILVPPGGGVAERFKSAGYPVRRFTLYGRHWRSIWRYWQSLGELVIPIIRSGADLVHINHHYGLEYTVRAAQLARLPFMVHIRGIEPVGWVEENRARLVLAGYTAAVSEAVRQRLIEGGIPADKVQPIHDGVDLECFSGQDDRSSQRAAWAVPEDCYLVGIAGQIIPLKGIADFLLAAHSVVGNSDRVRFAVIGDGPAPYVTRMKALVDELGLNQKVVFPGFQCDMHSVLSALDTLVMATYDPITGQGEGCGDIVLEAMASHIVVVARRAGAVGELLSDADGILVDPNGVEPLATGILRSSTLSCEERSAMIGHARETVQLRFTIQRQAHGLRSLYDHIVTVAKR